MIRKIKKVMQADLHFGADRDTALSGSGDGGYGRKQLPGHTSGLGYLQKSEQRRPQSF